MSRLPRGLTLDRDRYRVQFTSRHTRPGQRYRERLPLGTTKRQASSYLGKLREDDRLGVLMWPSERRSGYRPESRCLLGEWVINSYLPYCEAHNKPSTVVRKRYALQAVAPFFWGTPLDEIALPQVVDYQLTRKQEGVSNRTVNIEVNELYRALNVAVELEVLHTAPRKPKPLDPKKGRRELRALAEEEAGRALANAHSRGGCYYALTLFLLHTGARWGETRDLQWSDLDLDRGLVNFRASTAKHGRARELPLLPEVVEALRLLPRELPQVFARCYRGEWRAFRDSRVGSKQYPWEGEGGDLHVGPHTFRHTFATWKLQAGVSIALVSRWLGHSSITMTVDIYGHIETAGTSEEIGRGPRPQVSRLRAVGEEE